MRHALAYLAFVAPLLILSPLAGAMLAGRAPGQFLIFPPRTEAVAQPPFSLAVFVSLGLVVVLVIAPLASRVLRQGTPTRSRRPSRLPWWGWLGLAATAIAWLLAWSRFEWFSPWQRHTFTPLWLGYIVTVNALWFARSGWSLLTHRPAALAALFPLSTLFWWFYEYLNQYAGNWSYQNIDDFTAFEYAALASLSFSTVLPAVVSTCGLLATSRRLGAAAAGPPVRIAHPRLLAALALLLACASLALVGSWPTVVFPLVWLAPLALVSAALVLGGAATPFSGLTHGDWRALFVSGLAALLCGVFWELWNFASVARWVYAVPYVDRYHIFEMPLLGYAGYLPFGPVCLVVASLLPRAIWRPDEIWGSGSCNDA